MDVFLESAWMTITTDGEGGSGTAGTLYLKFSESPIMFNGMAENFTVNGGGPASVNVHADGLVTVEGCNGTNTPAGRWSYSGDMASDFDWGTNVYVGPSSGMIVFLADPGCVEGGSFVGGNNDVSIALTGTFNVPSGDYVTVDLGANYGHPTDSFHQYGPNYYTVGDSGFVLYPINYGIGGFTTGGFVGINTLNNGTIQHGCLASDQDSASSSGVIDYGGALLNYNGVWRESEQALYSEGSVMDGEFNTVEDTRYFVSIDEYNYQVTQGFDAGISDSQAITYLYNGNSWMGSLSDAMIIAEGSYSNGRYFKATAPHVELGYMFGVDQSEVGELASGGQPAIGDEIGSATFDRTNSSVWWGVASGGIDEELNWKSAECTVSLDALTSGETLFQIWVNGSLFADYDGVSAYLTQGTVPGNKSETLKFKISLPYAISNVELKVKPTPGSRSKGTSVWRYA